YETPISYFSSPVTANDAFFVRYHLAGIPEQIELRNWRLQVGGDGAANPSELTMEDLQGSFEQGEITAVWQCPGNRRGLSIPTYPVCSGAGCHGQCGVGWSSVQGCPGQSRAAQGDYRDRAERRRWSGKRQDAGFRQKHPDLEGARSEHDHRPPDER